MRVPNQLMARLILGFLLSAVSTYKLLSALIGFFQKGSQGDFSTPAPAWYWIVLCGLGLLTFVWACVSLERILDTSADDLPKA